MSEGLLERVGMSSLFLLPSSLLAFLALGVVVDVVFVVVVVVGGAVAANS